MSSNNLVPLFTISPTLTIIVGFMPTKSLARSETEVTFGVSEIIGSGVPEIGKLRPLEVFITRAIPE